MNVRPQHILVTGANGFIGSALCRKLSQMGYAVRGTVRSMKFSAAKSSHVEYVAIGDIGHHTNWNDALRDIDTVVHLASRAHVLKETASDPLAEYRRVNVVGTEQLARSATKSGVKRMVFLSSIGVNGEVTRGAPFTESDKPSPTRFYALSKWEAENILREIASQRGLEVVILRPPLVYGPGAKGNMKLLMDFIHRRWPLPFANVRNRRSFIGLDNLIDAITVTIERKQAAGQIFLLSDGQDVTTPDLITRISLSMNKSPLLFPVPRWTFSIMAQFIPQVRHKIYQLTESLVINSRKFQQTMDWIPPRSLDEGVTTMVTNFLAKR